MKNLYFIMPYAYFIYYVRNIYVRNIAIKNA